MKTGIIFLLVVSVAIIVLGSVGLIMGLFNSTPPLRHCDLDEDGDCDMVDLELARRALDKCEGDKDYLIRADVDQDKCVTEKDLATLFADFEHVLLLSSDPEELLQWQHPGSPMQEDTSKDCDLTGDGVCDSLDMEFFQSIFGSCLGDSLYWPAADADGNGCIDSLDSIFLFQTNSNSGRE